MSRGFDIYIKKCSEDFSALNKGYRNPFFGLVHPNHSAAPQHLQRATAVVIVSI